MTQHHDSTSNQEVISESAHVLAELQIHNHRSRDLLDALGRRQVVIDAIGCARDAVRMLREPRNPLTEMSLEDVQKLEWFDHDPTSAAEFATDSKATLDLVRAKFDPELPLVTYEEIYSRFCFPKITEEDQCDNIGGLFADLVYRDEWKTVDPTTNEIIEVARAIVKNLDTYKSRLHVGRSTELADASRVSACVSHILDKVRTKYVGKIRLVTYVELYFRLCCLKSTDDQPDPIEALVQRLLLLGDDSDTAFSVIDNLDLETREVLTTSNVEESLRHHKQVTDDMLTNSRIPSDVLLATGSLASWRFVFQGFFQLTQDACDDATLEELCHIRDNYLRDLTKRNE